MEERLTRAVRREAASRGVSVSALIARLVDDALKRPEPPVTRPFRLITVGGDGPRPGIDLDRPRQIEVLDDEGRYSRAAGRPPA